MVVMLNFWGDASSHREWKSWWFRPISSEPYLMGKTDTTHSIMNGYISTDRCVALRHSQVWLKLWNFYLCTGTLVIQGTRQVSSDAAFINLSLFLPPIQMPSVSLTPMTWSEVLTSFLLLLTERKRVQRCRVSREVERKHGHFIM